MKDDMMGGMPEMDHEMMLSELAKAQKGDNEDDAQELDVKHFEKMSDGDFISALYDFITKYLSSKPADRKPEL